MSTRGVGPSSGFRFVDTAASSMVRAIVEMSWASADRWTGSSSLFDLPGVPVPCSCLDGSHRHLDRPDLSQRRLNVLRRLQPICTGWYNR